MMRQFDMLVQALDATLQTGQLGTPVAVRLVAHGASDHGLLERLAARSLETASRWLQSQPRALHALGGIADGQISLLAAFAGGQTALISVGSCGLGPPLMEALVWGNRGLASWEGGAADERIFAGKPGDEPPLSAESQRLVGQLRDALAASQAERAGPRTAKTAASPLAATGAATPLKPPYGVLLVSGDHTHQTNYAEALAADPRCRLIGLTDETDISPRRRELNERLARRLNLPVLPDLGAALRRDDVQLVSICAEPMRRGRIIVQAAQAGKHLYLDKPLAGSRRDAQAAAAAIAQAGVSAHMFSQVQLEPAQRLRHAVSSGLLGGVTALHFDICFAKGHGGTAALGQPRRESATPQEYELPEAKRELTNVGVYPVVALLWLLGQRVRRVAATTGNYFFREHQTHDMEDFGQMLLELEDGRVATISAGRTGWRSHPAGGLHRAYVVGTRQAAAFDTFRPRVEVWADGPPWTAPERDPDDPMGMWAGPKAPAYTAKPKQAWIAPPSPGPNADAAYFLDCLEAGRPSEVSAPLAAAATDVLLAAYQSAARDGAFVTVE